jgi:hypothetical protein
MGLNLRENGTNNDLTIKPLFGLDDSCYLARGHRGVLMRDPVRTVLARKKVFSM